MSQTSTINATQRLARWFAPAAVLALTLTACGGASDETPSASPTASGRPGGPDDAQFQKIQECLTAAGITVPTPSGMPTGMPDGVAPTDRPTAMPSGPPPGGGTSGQGEPGEGGGPGGGAGAVLQSDEAKAALKACGITVPTGGPTPTSSTAP